MSFDEVVTAVEGWELMEGGEVRSSVALEGATAVVVRR